MKYMYLKLRQLPTQPALLCDDYVLKEHSIVLLACYRACTLPRLKLQLEVENKINYIKHLLQFQYGVTVTKEGPHTVWVTIYPAFLLN